MQQSFSHRIATAIDGLLYLSESEAPVDLLQWPDVCDLSAAGQKIAALTNTRPEDQTLQTPKDFRKPMEQMAVPEDPAMQEYAERWKSVFKKMEAALENVQVITTPVEDAQQQIYIVGFDACGATVLHTSAVVT